MGSAGSGSLFTTCSNNRTEDGGMKSQKDSLQVIIHQDKEIIN